MNYEIEFLKVGDADAILIREYINDTPYVILIDAGNVGDGKNVIIPHIKNHYSDNKTVDGKRWIIDLAICTHPDKDHKGGFFDLLESNEIQIEEFWLTDPAEYLSENDLKRYRNRDSAMSAVRKIFEHPTDSSKNLIDMAIDKCTHAYNAIEGSSRTDLGIYVVGPTEDYYKEIVKDMVSDYGVKTYEESDTTAYDENAKVDQKQAQSVIDSVTDDPSPYNKSSLIIYFKPKDDEDFLLAGDATRASLVEAIKLHPEIKNIARLKVPHHGSHHNLNTQIIDDLAPKQSFISCAGTSKHPNSTLVYWLSKYGDVYSTHKCAGYIHHVGGVKREGLRTLAPLKEKRK